MLYPAVDCGDPGAPPTNGQRTFSSTTYNSVVTYTCDTGYTVQGANSRTCQATGQWSGSVPQCDRKLVMYYFLLHSVLTSCEYGCTEQFGNIEEHRRPLCSHDHRWNMATQEATRLTCAYRVIYHLEAETCRHITSFGHVVPAVTVPLVNMLFVSYTILSSCRL